MVDRYKRYQRYKKFNDTESLNNCKQFYLGIDKKLHDHNVDILRDLGVNMPYAPNNIEDVPNFLNQGQIENYVKLFITMFIIL